MTFTVEREEQSYDSAEEFVITKLFYNYGCLDKDKFQQLAHSLSQKYLTHRVDVEAFLSKALKEIENFNKIVEKWKMDNIVNTVCGRTQFGDRPDALSLVTSEPAKIIYYMMTGNLGDLTPFLFSENKCDRYYTVIVLNEEDSESVKET